METDTTLFGTDASCTSTALTPSAGTGSGVVRLRRPDRAQMILDPSSLDERLSSDHAARSIWAVVQRMDLSGWEDQIQARGSVPGRAATDPRLLVGLLLLAATEGIGSCRRIAALCERDIAYRWMCGLR